MVVEISCRLQREEPKYLRVVLVMLVVLSIVVSTSAHLSSFEMRERDERERGLREGFLQRLYVGIPFFYGGKYLVQS